MQVFVEGDFFTSGNSVRLRHAYGVPGESEDPQVAVRFELF